LIGVYEETGTLHDVVLHEKFLYYAPSGWRDPGIAMALITGANTGSLALVLQATDLEMEQVETGKGLMRIRCLEASGS
jgi:hypothetical protein